MHIDAVIRQLTNLRQDRSLLFSAQQHGPQLRIRSMYRYIERRQPLLQNAFPFLVCQVSKRYVVAMHKREAKIVVHKIERFAHLLGLLVYKAEDALVLARVYLIAEVELEAEAGILIDALAKG